MFSKYKAKQIKHLSELPSGIRRRLQEHLIERMGERLYRRFSFFGGQIVDWPEFRRLEPNPGYKWKVFTYNLIFELRAPDVGITDYRAAIELDAAGDVIEMIGLPPAGRLALKAEISPLSNAYTLACTHGFDPSKTEAELRYDTEIESIVYRLTQRFRGKDDGRDHIMDVDAHSGRLLSVRWEDWYPHY